MIFEIFGSIVLLGVSGYLLKSFGWQGSAVFASIAAVLILKEIGEPLSLVFSSLKSVAGIANIGEPIAAAIKVLGLGYLFGICGDVCRELGEGGIAKAAEVVGRVEIIAVVMPYFEEIIKLGVEFMG